MAVGAAAVPLPAAIVAQVEMALPVAIEVLQLALPVAIEALVPLVLPQAQAGLLRGARAAVEDGALECECV